MHCLHIGWETRRVITIEYLRILFTVNATFTTQRRGPLREARASDWPTLRLAFWTVCEPAALHRPFSHGFAPWRSLQRGTATFPVALRRGEVCSAAPYLSHGFAPRRSLQRCTVTIPRLCAEAKPAVLRRHLPHGSAPRRALPAMTALGQEQSDTCRIIIARNDRSNSRTAVAIL